MTVQAETRIPETGRWWTLVAVCTGVFMLLLDVTIVNVALPDIQRQFDASLSGLQWVIDAYALSLAALLLTAGSLADIYGRRKVFVIGTALFTLGSLLCGLAPSIEFLAIARAGQGIGGAAMFATSLAILGTTYTGKDRGVAFGAFGATTGVAVAIGPVLGGILTSGLSWRWIFFVNLPICLVAMFISMTRVEESRNPYAGRPDWIGFVTFSSALGLLVYGLIEAGKDGWGHSTVVTSLVAAAVLMAAFVVSQLRQQDPMFDLALLRKPTFTAGLLAAFGVSASIFSLLTYIVIYLQNVLGYSAVETGLRLLFLSAAAFLASAITGRFMDHVPTRWLIGPGFLVLGVGLLLVIGIDTGSSWTHLIPGLIVSGIGVGMINPPLVSTAVGVVAPARAGMASGVNSTFRQVGIATGIAALGSIFSHQVAADLQDKLAGTPAAGQSGRIAEAVTGGQVAAVIEQAPAGVRPTLADAATSSFVEALNHIGLIAAVLAFAVGALCLVLIRQQDFVQHGAPSGTTVEEPEEVVTGA
ncbi:MFS transporter [Nocardioides endophyticus]|uniref:MFS transporter n=1 Tax=Nocardioides endophyticus TaxID=1353775 RepID=A0ABP8Z5D0_9ACTN